MCALLHNLLTESAKRHPEQIAVRFKDEKISYRDLDLSSDQLSALLIRKGVRTGDQVGVYIDKSIHAIIAIFSILKAGASYVPLDPLAPVDRHLLILNDCSLQYLISSSKKINRIQKILQQNNPLNHIFLPDINRHECKAPLPEDTFIFKEALRRPEENGGKTRVDPVEPGHLAYILYTSGSTGQPKGVMISHKASLSFVDWVCESFRLDHNHVISSVAPYHFDLSILDIFASIKAGATICIVPQGLSLFPKSLADFIEKNRITTWYSVPSLLTQLILYGNLEERDLSSLRQILFAGEVFPAKYLKKLMELIPHAEYYNLFGPTETNVCTCYHVTSPPLSDDLSIPIGKPCTGHDIFIVDEAGNLVTDDRIGELYVSGPNLMEGYWNDAQKTEKVLTKNPFSNRGERCCITGDLVNLNKDGHLAYHGRKDNMIKSRGYRIELGEIETIMSSHPEIKEVGVVGIPDEKIGNRIKAVIVLEDDGMISEQDLKLFCSKKLPGYMLPGEITFVRSMPRTSTGKIDRKKL